MTKSEKKVFLFLIYILYTVVCHGKDFINRDEKLLLYYIAEHFGVSDCPDMDGWSED